VKKIFLILIIVFAFLLLALSSLLHSEQVTSSLVSRWIEHQYPIITKVDIQIGHQNFSPPRSFLLQDIRMSFRLEEKQYQLKIKELNILLSSLLGKSKDQTNLIFNESKLSR